MCYFRGEATEQNYSLSKFRQWPLYENPQRGNVAIVPCCSPGAEGRHRGIAGDDDAAVLQADEGDEESDAHRDGVAQVERDGIDDGLAHLEEGEQDEDDALYQDGCQGLLPRVAHHQDQRVGKEGIDTHGRGQRKRQSGIERHDTGGDDGGNDRSRKDTALVHTCIAEDDWVDGEDVRHGEKCGQSGHHLHLHGMFLRVEP